MAKSMDIAKQLKALRGWSGQRAYSPEGALEGATNTYENIVRRRPKGAAGRSIMSEANEAYLEIQRRAMRDATVRPHSPTGLHTPPSATASAQTSGLINTNPGPVSTPDRLIPSSPKASTGPGSRVAIGYQPVNPDLPGNNYRIPNQAPSENWRNIIESSTGELDGPARSGTIYRDNIGYDYGGDGRVARRHNSREANIYRDYINSQDVDMGERPWPFVDKKLEKARLAELKPNWRRGPSESLIQDTGPATVDKRGPKSPDAKRTEALRQNSRAKKNPAKLKADQAKFAAGLKGQGGFIDPKLLKALGKVGLLGAATAGLEYFVPDNPIAQARKRGYKLTDEIGELFGVEGIKGGIENMDPGLNKTLASIGDSMLLDPLVSALGAGANMGDRLYGEMMGTNKKAKFKRTQGLGGRLQNRGLINGTP